MNVTKQFALAAAALMLVLAGCPSEDEKACSDFCGAGSACVGGTCQAVLTCDPGCTGDQTCVNGACTATVDAACSAGCAADQVCVVAADAAACVAVCGPSQQWNATTQQCEVVCSEGTSWDAASGTCKLDTANVHAAYFSAFSDTALANGPAVTAECIKCHEADAAQMAGAAHFKWLGPTPDLLGHEAATDFAGKKNLINNFCVAVASNETRCTQCHAGYGDPGTATTAGTPGYELTALSRVDCLICHADMATGYIKATANWGAADVAVVTGCSPACTATQVCVNEGAGPVCVEKTVKLPKVLKAAAKSVGRPDRANCGWCHFNAGGGDNVKVGDMASSLKAPTAAMDVHMGSDGGNMVCVDCHVTAEHKVFGSGVNLGVTEGRTACADCHSGAQAPTASIHTAKHLAKLACQTCHIPAFSRQLRTKMRWDWRLAGYKDCKFPVAPAEEAAWGDIDTDGDGYADTFPGATCAAVAASPSVSWTGTDAKHYEYDWRKGVFLKEDNVAPAYLYYDGKGSHLTIADGYAQAGSAADPVVIAAPTADSATVGARIYPFKDMRGTQPGMADGSFLIVPYLYPMKAADGTTVPGALWASTTLAATGETVASLQAKWNTLLTAGAKKGGQIGAADAIGTADWAWVETQMYMNINHEVAPTTDAIGAGGACGDCHSGGPSGICSLPGVTCGF